MSLKKKSVAPPVSVERGKDHMVIMPKNVLKQRAVVTHSGPPILDDTAIRRAEQALKALSVQYDGWMEEAADKLGELRAATVAEGFAGGRFAAFHRAAHDIRGQATTLGFPLASRVAGSLCLLLEELPHARLQAAPFPMLIDQHVDAIRAITREGVTKAKNPVGEALTAELEMVGEHLLANARGAVLQ
jgi:HPt (histidine-containing phosphotransfer) domain-containing protein